MNETPPSTDILIGVDTHKLTHAAVAISALGARLGSLTIPASRKGYQALHAWAQSFGLIRAFGIEGTGSYGAGLSRFLCEHGYPVFEVNRPNRQLRHQKGKDDALDAEAPPAASWLARPQHCRSPARARSRWSTTSRWPATPRSKAGAKPCRR